MNPVHIPGGGEPIHYKDEIVIPDYSRSGAHYFIIKYQDIGKYLDMLPLDEAGKTRADDFERKKLEAYWREQDPKYIAKQIGNKIWNSCDLGGEFLKISLVSEDDTEFSIIYPSWSTNLLWSGGCNVAKVLCTAPETEIEYLSGWSAGHLDPRKHCRLKKIYSRGWNEYTAYLMPNPELATAVRDSCRWLELFDNPDNDGIPVEKIAYAKRIILESYDLNDKLLRDRLVYDRESKKVIKESLHNWPFDVFNEKVPGKEFDWRPTE